MSEININRSSGTSAVSSKSYIWPKYHDGKVEKIKSPVPQEKQPVYLKPDPAEKRKLEGMMFKSEQQYNSYGKSDSRTPLVKPGSFFDALA